MNLSGQAHYPISELRAVPAGPAFPAVPRDMVRVASGKASPALSAHQGEGGLISLTCAVQVSADVWVFLKHVAMGVPVVSIKQ